MQTNKTQARLLTILTIGHGTNDFYSVLLPVLLPVIAVEFGLSYTQFGFILLITTISSGFLQPYFGYVADRHGFQKQMVIMGFLMFALGLIGYSVSSTFAALIAFSFLYGLGETTFHAQSTGYITATFKEGKGRAMGVHGLGGSIGNFLAPVMAALLITVFEWRLAAVVLVLPAIVVIGVLLTNLKNKSASADLSLSSGITPDILVLGVNFGLIIMFHKGFLAFLPTWLLEGGLSLPIAGAMTSLMLIVGIIAQPIGGMLFDRYGGRVVFIISPVIASIALSFMTTIAGWLMIPMIVCIGAATTMTFPVALTMASVLATDGKAGTSAGLVFGIGSTMSSFTPVATGYLADQLGLATAFPLLIVLPILTIMTSLLLLSDQ